MTNSMIKKIKRLAFILAGGGLYFMAFFFVEDRKVPVTILHTPLDDIIPFCEYFIIPYLMWFVFVIAAVLYFTLFNEKDNEFHSFIASLIFGMGLFILISFLFPNGQNLRPDLGMGNNIFQKACIRLYGNDTSTNILPSLHVYNAVACNIAFSKNERVRNRPVLITFINVLTVMIVLSTMFLKQHCVIDVVAALVLNYIAYLAFYKAAYAAKVSEKLSVIENHGFMAYRRRRRHDTH
ncbi:MAG: phosphatase PAP2 family protein [Clostridia bacterium]|nr:phosphatase PAP2 family protein [Clostridia bacterium]